MESLGMLLLLLVLMLGPMLIVGFMVLASKKWLRNRNRRSPLTEDQLRPPGFSTQKALDELNLNLDGYLVGLLLALLMMYVFWLRNHTIAEQRSQGVSAGWFLFAGFAIAPVLFWKVIELVQLRQKYVEGRGGELATAQLLEPLVARGGRFLHDVQARGFNIDHVVIAPGGVFAVETKHRLKPTRLRGKEAATVESDARTVRFPGWVETKPLEQAKRQAAWLQKELTKAVGVKIPVQPVVALPGWYVQRTAPGGVLVINPKNHRFVTKARGQQGPLSVERINTIAYQVARLCEIPDSGS